ncbi:MAG TPA: hypothetical protein VJR67_02025 [Candidatus Nitrosopolaris sp.]|nr:hypothetical protein [Candidatus Nitrosopolaris sp.]
MLRAWLAYVTINFAPLSVGVFWSVTRLELSRGLLGGAASANGTTMPADQK